MTAPSNEDRVKTAAAIVNDLREANLNFSEIGRLAGVPSQVEKAHGINDLCYNGGLQQRGPRRRWTVPRADTEGLTSMCAKSTRPLPTLTSEQKDRFWQKVRKSDGCWEWTAARNGYGYGIFGPNRKTFLAHRLSWSMAHGDIPDGLHVLHHCDNPSCVRPDHLFIGTAKDNVQDMIRKGRKVMGPFPRGEDHPNTTLTEEDVRAIRRRFESGESRSDLARAMGVCHSTICNILHGRTWAGVGMDFDHSGEGEAA